MVNYAVNTKKIFEVLSFFIRPFRSVVLNQGYMYHLGVRGAKVGVRSTKVFRDTRSGNLNLILLNIHRDSL